MISNNLIQECSCGETKNFISKIINDIPLLICNVCDVPHQCLPGWTPEMIVEMYKTTYHSEEQKKIGLREYKDRYNHDYKVAKLRLDAYHNYISRSTIGLDVGSSNSAFVHAARHEGLDFIGIDPGHEIGDSNLTIRSTIQDYEFEDRKFNLITMHDSLEHMVEVRNIVTKIVSILEDKGFLIIDIPDYYVPEGIHHWRPVQHLWYWNKHQMIQFLNYFNLSVVEVANPIPGKLVFYAQKITC